MNCLKCDNYWKTNIDENKCERCGCVEESSEAKEEEGKDNEQKASDLC